MRASEISTLPHIATVIPIKLAVFGSSGSESAIGDVQGKVKARQNGGWCLGRGLDRAEEGGNLEASTGKSVPVNEGTYILQGSEESARGPQ